MVGGTTSPGLAQTQEPCPEGSGPFVIVDPEIPDPPTVVEGCGYVAEGPDSCQGDFEFIPQYNICFDPFDENPPPPPPPPPPTPLTKEACKEDFVALGFENQGQCIKEANHLVE
jgi:hypothetical protein